MKLKKFLAVSNFIFIASSAYADDPYDQVIMCKPCPVGMHGYGTSTVCIACETGKYNNQLGQTECTQCSEGTYQNETGKTGCKTCDAGYKCPSKGMSSATPCGPGTYQPSAGQTVCLNVPAGNCSTGSTNTGYTSCLNKAGRTACNVSTCAATSCSVGYYLSGGECYLCEKGYRCPGDNNRYICSAGTYSSSGASSCTNCSAGSYSSSAGSSSCTTCSGNDYQPNAGQTRCYPCDTSTPSCTETTVTITTKELKTNCHYSWAGGSCNGSSSECCYGSEFVYGTKTECTTSSTTKYGTANTRTTTSCSGRSTPTCKTEKCP